VSYLKRKSWLALIIIFCFVISCGYSPKVDNYAGLTRDDFRYTLTKKPGDKKDKVEITKNPPSIPKISKLLVSPPPPPIGNGELISFSVTEEVPLKDVLIELGRVADLDIEVDPEITGGIILKVEKKPLKTVIERICDLGSLRYTYTDGILSFAQDTPYTKHYTVDFLIGDSIWGSLESSMQEILTNNGDEDAKIDINKNASLISIYANSFSQIALVAYMDMVKESYSAQVLIEAKVVEVKLNDDFRTGIDWSMTEIDSNSSIHGTNLGTLKTMNYADGQTSAAIVAPFSTSLNHRFFGENLTATIRALETFGTTRTLSSPRVHAINNQEATLDFTNTLVYFSIETEQDTETDSSTTTATKQEEDIGVKLTITPSINTKEQTITLDVLPELSVKADEVTDPTNSLNKVPVIQTRKMDTSLKLKSGETMVIGGLMNESSSNSDVSVPFLGRIPILGWLFSYKSRSTEVTETVIFIKATIIDQDNPLKQYDKDFYKKFSTEKNKLF